MYNKLRLVENVKSFTTKYNIEVIYFKDDKIFFNGKEDSESRFITFLENGYWARGIKNSIHLYNINSDKVEVVTHAYLTNCFNSIGGIYSANNNYDSIQNLFLYDYFYHDRLTNKEIKLINQKTGSFVFCFSSNTKAIFKSINLLSSHILNDGLKEWEIDISNYGEIKNVIIVVNNILWVYLDYKLENTKKGRLVAIDINTGQIVPMPVNDGNLFTSNILYNEAKQTAIFITKQSAKQNTSTLIEVCLKTGTILRKVLMQSLLDKEFEIVYSVLHNNKIYATLAFQKPTTPRHIGVIDVDSLDLVWYDEPQLENDVFFKFNMQVSDNNIYVLDTTNTLHIYEKEN